MSRREEDFTEVHRSSKNRRKKKIKKRTWIERRRYQIKVARMEKMYRDDFNKEKERIIEEYRKKGMNI